MQAEATYAVQKNSVPSLLLEITRGINQFFPEGHRVRDGTLARWEFIELVKDLSLQIQILLQEAADYEVGYREKTPLAKTNGSHL